MQLCDGKPRHTNTENTDAMHLANDTKTSHLQEGIHTMHRNTQREYIIEAMHPLLRDRKTDTDADISKETYSCCWNETTPYTCLIILHTKLPKHDHKIKS